MWWNNSLITSGNLLVRFPSFILVNCLLMFYFVFSIFVFWIMLMEPGNTPVRLWPRVCRKCVSGLQRLKKLEFFQMHTCVGPAARILLRHKWRNWDAASPSLLCVCDYSCVVCKIEFFSSVGQVLGWNFLVLNIFWNVCRWVPKIWQRMDWFWSSLLECACK